MSSFYAELYQIAEGASPQVAMDLGILAGFLSGSTDTAVDETRQTARASLLRLARLLVDEPSESDHVDLDDAMDQEEEAAAANGQIL